MESPFHAAGLKIFLLHSYFWVSILRTAMLISAAEKWVLWSRYLVLFLNGWLTSSSSLFLWRNKNLCSNIQRTLDERPKCCYNIIFQTVRNLTTKNQPITFNFVLSTWNLVQLFLILHQTIWDRDAADLLTPACNGFSRTSWIVEFQKNIFQMKMFTKPRRRT